MDTDAPTARPAGSAPVDGPHDHDGGLGLDLPRLLGRRRALSLLGAAGVVALVGCGSGDDDTAASASSSTSTTAGAATGATSTTASSGSGASTGDCAEIPEETAGPFPGDGSNGPDVLTESGVVRRDITSSFGSSSTVAGGVPLTIRLAVQDAGTCAARPGAAVYVWHCDREGRYSLYSPGVEGENYLRGVQEAGDDGVVTFTSIFPAAYSGRWPHIHFEVYPDLDAATSAGDRLATSQVALPEEACSAVYATDGYEQSVANLAGTSLEGDMVFGDDGAAHQLGTVSGDVDSGYTVELAVPV